MNAPHPDLRVYFNFRSPYCYLASKRMFTLFDAFAVNIAWKPLGGWNGRSPPERAKSRVPIARQDVGRWTAKMGIPFNPPPVDTDPTNPALVSLHAERHSLLRPYVVEVMRAEWGHGRDIGQPDVLRDICAAIGAPADMVDAAIGDAEGGAVLEGNWVDAQADGVIGVPSFVIDGAIFWGNDRIDFLRDHLTELRLARI